MLDDLHIRQKMALHTLHSLSKDASVHTVLNDRSGRDVDRTRGEMNDPCVRYVDRTRGERHDRCGSSKDNCSRTVLDDRSGRILNLALKNIWGRSCSYKDDHSTGCLLCNYRIHDDPLGTQGGVDPAGNTEVDRSNLWLGIRARTHALYVDRSVHYASSH